MASDPMLQWQRVWVVPVHTRNQLQLPLAASLGKGKNTERIKQLQAWVFGLYSFFADAEYLHPSPGAMSGASPGDWGRGGGGWQPNPMMLLRGCLGDAKALCKGTCHTVTATKDSHITQTTCTKKTPPE